MCQPLLTVEAHCLETAVSQHLGNLRILLAVFTEDQLALVVVVLVLSTSPVLSTLLIDERKKLVSSFEGHSRHNIDLSLVLSNIRSISIVLGLGAIDASPSAFCQELR